MSGPFNFLSELATFSAGKRIPVSDARTVDQFIGQVHKTAIDAVASQARLHGHRTQEMFEALVLSLNKHRLLKVEDSGRVHPADSFSVPDFRVVLADGSQWLIEVKNVYHREAKSKKRRLMKRAYRERLEAYASATGSQLKLATYWARWGVWTLVSPNQVADADGIVTLDMPTAMRVNELGELGDVMIGTRPPLKLVIRCEPKALGCVGPDGMAKISIASAQIFCDNNEIINPVEQEIAWIFMRFGNWQASMQPEIQGNFVKAVIWHFEPVEHPNAKHGFEMIGSLSELFARYYDDRTIKGSEVVQIQATPKPQWFAPLLTRDYESETLPLWHFELRPELKI